MFLLPILSYGTCNFFYGIFFQLLLVKHLVMNNIIEIVTSENSINPEYTNTSKGGELNIFY